MPELKLQQSRLDGRFDILECLGRGSYAEIYVARDNSPSEGAPETVVIKALNMFLQDTPDRELEQTLIANFQNEAVALDRVRHPLISRTRGILLGSILLLAVTAALVSAKTLPFMFAVTLAAFLVAAVTRRDSPIGKLRLPGAPTIHLLLLLLYALLSATWAIRPDIAAVKTLVAMAMAVGTATIIALIRRETRPNLLHMGEGVCIGVLIGLVYLLVELLSDQSIKLAIYRAVGVRPDDVTPIFFTWSDGS